MKLRATLVDDECPACKELNNLLEPFENVKIVGEAVNNIKAPESNSNLDPSVIFLDIAMSSLNGIDLAYLLREKSDSLSIIFTTVDEEYAFVFALTALDCLPKPIHPKRLEEALMKVRQIKSNLTGQKSNILPPKNEIIPPSPNPLEVVPVELRGKIILLNHDEIIYIYTDKDKVYIKTHKESYLTRFTLRELELRLDTTLFFRSHRCYLVNIKRMRELIPYFNGTYTIVVDDHERSEIPMSRTKSRILKEMLGL